MLSASCHADTFGKLNPRRLHCQSTVFISWRLSFGCARGGLQFGKLKRAALNVVLPPAMNQFLETDGEKGPQRFWDVGTQEPVRWVTSSLIVFKDYRIDGEYVEGRVNTLRARDETIGKAIELNNDILTLIYSTGDPEETVSRIRELLEERRN